MSFNWKEINHALLLLQLPGAHIQQISQPDFHNLYFKIYRPGDPVTVLFSLDTNANRVAVSKVSLKKTTKVQRFTQFLRSRIRGGKILSTWQLDRQRIIRIAINRSGEITLLWFRLWGGSSNLIVTDENSLILDCMFRRPKRNEVSGAKYIPLESSVLPTDTTKSDIFQVRDFGPPSDWLLNCNEHYLSISDNSKLQSLKKSLLKKLQQRETTLKASLEKLQKQRQNQSNPERFKQLGDLILANSWKIPQNAESVTVEDFYNNNNEVYIELQSEKSPHENAEEYFKKSKKSHRGNKTLDEKIDNLQLQLTRMTKEIAEVEKEASIEIIDQLAKAENESDTDKKEPEAPGLTYFSGNFRILVGRSAKENDVLLRKFVRGNDWWLHTRDFPGGYVFIKVNKGQSVPLETLLDAGNLALYYSKGRNGGSGELYYTQVKYLRRAKHGNLGTVIPTQEKNLSLKLDNERLKKVFDLSFEKKSSNH